ncbi:TIGR03826 family flagellar region protein [Oceanobacillus sp. CFH 90083]|uniref:TIGR03826 family flagellar region protein n=1 Tax=Oceanobacillus sp. CFH 90083 TaxID=2592336 RepID=UPI00128BC486|nr:TIGR03826 family flagellar region protein [Oceanobacillus sp. CFH 90083]
MGELANCERCNRVFVKQLRGICNECYQKEEADFRTVYNFLRKRDNRKATIRQIVAATGVDESLIYKFIREKRLQPSSFPNLSYPCERCQQPITEGSLCESCQTQLKEDLIQHDAVESIQKKGLKEEKEATYYAKGEWKKD